ncbi:MAG: type III pantothenate kinase [Planctomycetota bacterium]
MRAVADIGNTTTRIGSGAAAGLAEVHAFPSDPSSCAGIAALLSDRRVRRVLASSVNPAMDRDLAVRLAAEGITLTPVTPADIPLTVRYDPPESLGIDRLVAAYAARARTGRDSIVVSMGTAITVEVVTGPGAYHGGFIVPGTRLLLESLSRGTALLPLVPLGGDGPDAIPACTRDAIGQGVFHGVAAMVRGLVARAGTALGADPAVVLTGGDAAAFASVLPAGWLMVPDLVVEGLWRLAREHRDD